MTREPDYVHQSTGAPYSNSAYVWVIPGHDGVVELSARQETGLNIRIKNQPYGDGTLAPALLDKTHIRHLIAALEGACDRIAE